MTRAAVLSRLDQFQPVALDALNDEAALQTRVDRKYVLTREAADELLARIADHDADVRVLDIDGCRRMTYESTYFDTPDLAAYRLSAHRRPSRFKVRTRTYVDSDQCMFEVKFRTAQGATVKHRIDHPLNDNQHLNADARRFLGGFETLSPLTGRLRPTLTTRYQRTTLLWDQCRTTLDVDVICELATGAVSGPRSVAGLPARATFRHRVIVETKCAGGVGNVDRLLWSMGLRPSAVSKYATGVAALCPQLPRNEWHRTLNRHVTIEY